MNNAYVTGVTFSTDFPTVNPFQASSAGNSEAFVLELNPAGNLIVYSSYLGGAGDDEGLGLAADAAGNIYVTGVTASLDFPTLLPLQPANGGLEDAFVTKISWPDGCAKVITAFSSSRVPDL